ncbi:MAG TPA: exodeoxyribonuclease VII large subunit [Baekduia sp.]|uniref:exodeoxyribonuclease VII large subunit n=1 Tax=Baekduia sp. TaxID=2600305 RepID=UPI002BA67734|nr:exodeoxyribonuclease VII large subunit [Baekduia sp.]HMJ35221.1 exodeoxyribonuclease VII large subunit [Baekduia sp.]
MSVQPRPDGIAGSSLAGPFPVGAYAEKLRDELRKRARVQLFGEVWNFRASKAKVYFELRDGDGAVPCSMWRNDFERLGFATTTFTDGARVVAAGGPGYYPGSRTSSPSFSFDVTGLRIAGEGDLLAQMEALRRALGAEGLFAAQKALALPELPRCIGVVTGEGGKARDDVLAGLRRRGWAGRLVWAFAPVQDRHAAPRITQALQDLAAIEEVEVVIVARGGGSLADLFAFCDETLCRTVAMLRVPVIASVGHHTDRTLIDDVAAVSCSTPTHAAESAVPCHPLEARQALARCAAALEAHGRRAVVGRARHLAALSRAPAQAIERHRVALRQRLRELRASARRRLDDDAERAGRRALALSRKAAAAGGPEDRARRTALESLASALAAHDPERTVARGYAIVDDGAGGIVTSAVQARELGDVRLFFADGDVGAHVEDIKNPEEGA